jgi:hypothetical protein
VAAGAIRQDLLERGAAVDAAGRHRLAHAHSGRRGCGGGNSYTQLLQFATAESSAQTLLQQMLTQQNIVM